MSKYVPDIKTQRWVVIAPTRVKRPVTVDQPTTTICPFCPGNEHRTPPEVYRIGLGEKDGPGWQVRVVPNKYPITDIHEVIIHSPDSQLSIEHLPGEQVEWILSVYRQRYYAHEGDGHVLIFCNQGESAGASLVHPHSQLVVVPQQITLDALSLEPVLNVVEETEYFTSYCPDFSQWSYEVWIAPKEGNKRFCEISDPQIQDLARLLPKTLLGLEAVTKEPTFSFHLEKGFAYNYYISHGDNWFLRVIPRFFYRAGFELGTGLSAITVDPKDAADELKGVALSSK